jgi:hypothetical protein
LLGEEKVRKASDEVYDEFGKKQEPKLWEIFLHGTKDQWEQVREEIWREIEDRDREKEPPESRGIATQDPSEDHTEPPVIAPGKREKSESS